MSITKIGEKLNKDNSSNSLKNFGLGLGAAQAGTSLTNIPTSKMVSNIHKKSLKDSLGGKDVINESEKIIDELKKGGNIKDEIRFGYSENPKSLTSSAYKLFPEKYRDKIVREFYPEGFYSDIAKQKDVLDRGGSVVHGLPDKAILSHELGHATGKLSKSKPYQVAAGVGRLGMITGPLASIGSAYMGSKNEDGGKLEKAVTYGPAAIATPALFEEGRASARGLNMIRKADGLKAALKAAPKLGLAGSTYAALAGAPIIANRVASRNRKDNEGDR